MKLLLVFIITFLLMCSTTIARDVTLAWDKNTEETLAGYRLYAREDGQSYNYDDPEWDGNQTICTIKGFDEYTTYHFVARAYDKDNMESGDSNEVTLEKLEYDEDNTQSDNNTNSSGSSGCFINSLMEINMY